MVLVGVLVGTGVLMGFVALAVDGGSTLLQRRIMQNAADAAAMGAAQLFANNVAYQGRQPDVGQPHAVYIVRNQDVVANVDELLRHNRGGTVGEPITYTAVISYGIYNTASRTYLYRTAAISSTAEPAQQWVYPDEQIQPNSFVPPDFDAVQVSTSVDNPMTFARVIGINSINVRARSAAALNGDRSYVPQGPTWPMTSNFYLPSPGQSFTYTSGICQPVLFYYKVHNNPNKFENLLSMAASEGKSFRNEPGPGTPTPTPQPQMITAPDERSSLVSKSNSPRRISGDPCNDNQMDYSRWDADGSCSRSGEGYGNNIICCRISPDDYDVSDLDVPNWISYDFKGIVSISTTHWIDIGRRAAGDAPGDWIETYLGTNHISRDEPPEGNDVIVPLQNYILLDGTQDPLSSANGAFPGYGPHVDKVIYMYDQGEVWRQVTPTPPGLLSQAPAAPSSTPTGTPSTSTPTPIPTDTPTPTPYYAWRPLTPTEQPDRVHVAKAYKFRFYYGMVDNASLTQVPQLCGNQPIHQNSYDHQVYAVPVGEVLNKPPTDPDTGQPIVSPHWLYNYVGFVDVSQ